MSDWPPRHLRDPAGRWDLTDANLETFPDAPHYRLGDLLAIMLEHGSPHMIMEGEQLARLEMDGSWVPLGDQALTRGECFWLALRPLSENERRNWVAGGQLEHVLVHQQSRFSVQATISAGGIRVVVRLLEAPPEPPPPLPPPPPLEEPPLPAASPPPGEEVPATVSPRLVASFNGRFYAHLEPDEISLWSGLPPQHQGSVPGLGVIREAFLSDSGQLFLRMDRGLFRAGDDWEEIAALGPLIRGEGSARLGRLAVRRDGAQLIYERISPMVAGGAGKVGRRKTVRRSGHQLMLLDLESSRQRPYFAAESEEEGQIVWAASPAFAYLAAVQPTPSGHQVDLIDLAAEQILARFAIAVSRLGEVQVNDEGTVLVTADAPACWTLARPGEGALDVLELEAIPASRVLLAREHITVIQGSQAQEVGFDGQPWRETWLDLAAWPHTECLIDERSQLLVLGWSGQTLQVLAPWQDAPEPAPPPAAPPVARPTLPLAELLGFMQAHRVQRALIQEQQPIMMERDGRRIPWGSYLPPAGEVAVWVGWERREMGDPAAIEFDVYFSQQEFRVRLVGSSELVVEPA